MVASHAERRVVRVRVDQRGVRAHRRRHRASRPLSCAHTLGTRRTLEEMVLFQEVVTGWRAVLAVDAYG